MLTYKITLRCGKKDCPSTKTVETTIVKPGEYDIPTLTMYNSPWGNWSTVEGETTLCPAHAKEDRERKEQERKDQEELERQREQDEPRDPIATI